jgi:hypothetical protein
LVRGPAAVLTGFLFAQTPLFANVAFAGCTNTIEVAEQGNFEIHQIAGTTNGTLTASGSKWSSPRSA